MKKSIIYVILCSLLLFPSCAPKVLTAPENTTVVVVKKTPKHYKRVIVKGKRYYYWGGRYYKRSNQGYVAVRF